MGSGGPLNKFLVVFDRNDAVYLPGETLTGHLLIELREAAFLRVVKLQFKGRACFLGDSSKQGEVEKVYFNRDIVLFDRPPGKEPGGWRWEAGVHQLPFECPLPRVCATSYEGGQGFIRYFCRAVLVQAHEKGREVNFVTKNPFTVLSPPTPLPEAEANQPAGTSESLAVKGCCCMQGRLVADVRVSKSGFVPGETATGSLKVDNRSREPIDGVRCQLVERLGKSTSERESRSERVLLDVPLEQSTVPARDSINRDTIPLLKIPAVAPSIRSAQNPSMTLFELNYELRFLIGSKMTLSLPILIGGVSGESGLAEFVLGPQRARDADDPKDLLGKVEFAPRYPTLDSTNAVRQLKLHKEAHNPLPVVEINGHQNSTTAV